MPQRRKLGNPNKSYSFTAQSAIDRRILSLSLNGLNPSEIAKETGFPLDLINQSLKKSKHLIKQHDSKEISDLVKHKMIQVFNHHSMISEDMVRAYDSVKSTLVGKSLIEDGVGLKALTLLAKEIQRNDKALALWMVSMGVAGSFDDPDRIPDTQGHMKNIIFKKVMGMGEGDVLKALEESNKRLGAWLGKQRKVIDGGTVDAGSGEGDGKDNGVRDVAIYTGEGSEREGD